MVILGAGVYPRLEARGQWRSGVKGRGLCGWETLEMIGGALKRRQLAKQGLGGGEKELEVGWRCPEMRAL